MTSFLWIDKTMFTGIIQDIGIIKVIDPSGDPRLVIAPTESAIRRALTLGASVACSGVCLTVIALGEGDFTVQVSSETLSKTTAASWQVGTRLNLEPALRLGDELGGHMVSGHVDGVARLIESVPEKQSVRLTFEVPLALAPFIAPKGSVALDGISLTVNEVEGARFGVNIIPFTQTATTLGDKKIGECLNLEIDPIARYMARMLEQRGFGA
jgi:riboflavin synthase